MQNALKHINQFRKTNICKRLDVNSAGNTKNFVIHHIVNKCLAHLFHLFAWKMLKFDMFQAVQVFQIFAIVMKEADKYEF